MNESSILPRKAMLGIALLQGVCLYALYHAIDTDSWPSHSPLWSFPLWTLAILAPLMLLLSIDTRNYRSAATQLAVFAALLALLAVYTGWQASPYNAFPVEGLSFAFAASITLASFKALMYLQQRADGAPLSYAVLFTNSWRNFLVGVLSGLFAFIFWLILMLWAQLFKVIQIDFFYDLFTKDWFIIPALCVAFGLGITLFRDLTRVIDNIAKLLHWLILLLLPLVLVVAIVFLAALPFVGLGPLWSTGKGTALLLWLLATLLFFTNAVYQDGREADPYPAWIHRLIMAGLCLTPVIAALSLYGLTLRLGQYGWTVQRCWALVAWATLSLFSLGYVGAILRGRSAWTTRLGSVNTAMGLVVLAIMLLANSPLLDFRKISLHSQLGRVESGEIELREFDFWYAKNQLARPGYLAMEKMKKGIGDSDPELLAMIENPTYGNVAQQADVARQMWARLVSRPEEFPIPADLKPLVDTAFRSNSYMAGDPVMFRADLDEDGQFEYLLLVLQGDRIGFSEYYYRTHDGWQNGYLQGNWNFADKDLRERILEGDFELVTPRYRDFEVAGIRFRPMLADRASREPGP
jgi:Domain of unknown function (DUF4153)